MERLRIRAYLWLGVLGWLLLCIPASAMVRVYSIGNSHTYNLLPHYGFPKLVEQAGLDMKNSWHIRNGSNLRQIVANPEDINLDSSYYNDYPNTFPDALYGYNWDVVIVQTFFGSSGNKEIEALQTILSNLHPSRTPPILYLYSNWPTVSGEVSMREGWLEPAPEPDDPIVLNRRFFIWFYKALQEAELPVREVRYIPVGEVLYELDKDFRAGVRPEFTKVDDLYGDITHMGNVGRYVIGLTTLAVVFDYDVRQLGAPPRGYHNNGKKGWYTISADLADYLQEVVMRVVDKKPFSAHSILTAPRVATDRLTGDLSLRYTTYRGYNYTAWESTDLHQWTVCVPNGTNICVVFVVT